MNNSTQAAGDHEEVIILVGEGEELVEREALFIFLLRLGRHCFCLYCCIRHWYYIQNGGGFSAITKKVRIYWKIVRVITLCSQRKWRDREREMWVWEIEKGGWLIGRGLTVVRKMCLVVKYNLLFLTYSLDNTPVGNYFLFTNLGSIKNSSYYAPVVIKFWFYSKKKKVTKFW